jgi:hypothetical protein
MVSKILKIKTHEAAILPVVLYWSLKLAIPCSKTDPQLTPDVLGDS